MNYFENTDKISQSRLKKILIHPRMYMSKGPVIEEDEKIHFVIGNAVDCLITEPDKFEEQFYVLSAKAPSGQIKQFIDAMYELGNENDAFSKVNSQKYKVEWFKEKMELADNKLYFDALKTGKSILDFKTYETITNITNSINSFEEYKKLLQGEIVSQLEIFWEYEGVDMKSKLDFIVIDHDGKSIQPIDVKTLGDSTASFKYSFWKRRYDFQAAAYQLALEHWKKGNDKLQGYTILPFKFVVESSKYQGSPLVYEISPSSFDVGLNGGEVDGRYYEGFKQAVERLKWHMYHEQWDYTREQIEVGKTIII